MPGHDLIVVGASIGGLEALRSIVAGLPPDLPAAVCVVWHLAPDSPALLPEILARAGPLPALHPQDGDALQPGRIYVAPPDQHLLLEAGRLRLSRGPKENRFRPAIDPLFRSAARAYGPRVIGVILSGALDDGTAGMAAIKARGGLTVIQDPREAHQPLDAPARACPRRRRSCAFPPPRSGRCWPTSRGRRPPGRSNAMAEHLEIETRIALADTALEAGVMRLGPPSPYTCPDCHGTLLEITSDGITRFRCHTGHAYAIQQPAGRGQRGDRGHAVERRARRSRSTCCCCATSPTHAREVGDAADGRGAPGARPGGRAAGAARPPRRAAAPAAHATPPRPTGRPRPTPLTGHAA